MPDGTIELEPRVLVEVGDLTPSPQMRTAVAEHMRRRGESLALVRGVEAALDALEAHVGDDMHEKQAFRTSLETIARRACKLAGFRSVY